MLLIRERWGFGGALLAAAILGACGGGRDTSPVPPNAEIAIAPTDYQWEISPVAQPCIIDPSYYHDHLVNIAATNDDDQPLGEVDLHVTLDLTGATFSGTSVMGLYDDLNGNGAADDDELVSTDGRGAYTVKTGKYDGTKQLWVRVNLSCPYRGTLSAFSGAASDFMEIQVVEKSE